MVLLWGATSVAMAHLSRAGVGRRIPLTNLLGVSAEEHCCTAAASCCCSGYGCEGAPMYHGCTPGTWAVVAAWQATPEGWHHKLCVCTPRLCDIDDLGVCDQNL